MDIRTVHEEDVDSNFPYNSSPENKPRQKCRAGFCASARIEQ